MRVRCASSGNIALNLHNVSQLGPSRPLVIYLPPFSHRGDPSPTPIPRFLQSYPVAVINYRWLDPTSNGPVTPSSQWPFPIHDTLFGYSWLLETFTPPETARRDVYVYGSYLGASLAAGLALSETYPHQRMAVRGVMAYNGIYNWTMFLPDHPVHRDKSLAATMTNLSLDDEGSYFNYLRRTMPTLFASPSHLFDPFASPSLFFHNPGLLVPEDFNTSTLSKSLTSAIDALAESSSSSDIEEDQVSPALKAPRKSYLGFPPRHSTLKIPEALLMYEQSASEAKANRRAYRGRRGTSASKKKPEINDFDSQAAELAGLMRRSVEKVELRDRKKWDVDYDDDGEAARRVEVRNVGSDELDGELGQHGQNVAAAWLEERIG